MNSLHRFGCMSVTALLLSACGGSNQTTTVMPQPNGAASHHLPKRNASGCFSIQDSTGATYTAARLGGGNPVDVEYAATPCQIGIYINGTNGPNTLDATKVNGPFAIGIYFDTAGSGAREDHTQICVNGSNGAGGCLMGTATSPGTGLDIRNTPNFSADHTSIDSYAAGFATNPCPNLKNSMTADHAVITNATYPWSYEGGNNNFNFNPGHNSPPFNGQSCAGSGVGTGVSPGGNLYVADTGNHAIKEILAAGGYATTNTLSSAINEPASVALDGSGNLYVGGEGDNNVYQLLAAGGYSTINALGSGFCTPYGTAVDANGNVFVGDSCNHAVKEILAAGGYTTVKTLGSGFMYPGWVALDANGNVFVTDESAPAGNSAVKEILAAGGYTTVNTLAPGFNFVYTTGIALDANGNVYVADTGCCNVNGAVREILAAGGYTTVNTLGSGFVSPWGIAVDGSGNVYVSDYTENAVKEMLAVGGSIPSSPTIVTLGSGFSNPEGIALQNPAVVTNVRLVHRRQHMNR